MNADESQAPKPATEPVDEPEERITIISSLADLDLEPAQPKPAVSSADIEPPQEQLTRSSTQPKVENVDHEPTETQEPFSEPELEFLTQLEEQISVVEALEEQEDDSENPAAQTVAQLQRQEQALRQEIATLQASHQVLLEQLAETQTAMGRVVQEALMHLEQRKQTLQIAVEQLERRQERIRTEMRTTFAGASQDLAIRVQGFKDYLTGSLQDLAAAAEQLELVPAKEEPQKSVVKQPKPGPPSPTPQPQFTEQRFQSTTKQVQRILDQYRTKPDYYGPPWQLRRTFEPVHAERVSHWFFTQGGRGALRTMGSRLQNILISSAVISVLYTLYSDRLRALVLANTPERLGDWRRGLQDCLGISRSDFGPERGVVLFESAEAVALKAERLIKANQMPLIIIDDSEDTISLSLLQFPLLLAFAPDPRTARDKDYDF